MSKRVSTKHVNQGRDPAAPRTHPTGVLKAQSPTMASREHGDASQAPSYPSPTAAQVNQGVSYYTNQRQLTADELHLSAELTREVSASNINENPTNGINQGQAMVLGSPNPNPPVVNRGNSAEQAQGQSQSHMTQFTPNQQTGVDPNHELSYGDQSARRKRTKVSRACDECRRKKVRCDATSESGVDMCSNCRRTGSNCEFSRVPMKRGPSKGYIKELADRINTLESQMQPGLGSQQEVQYQQMNEDGSSAARGYQEFPPTVDNNMLSRKRTYSMTEPVAPLLGLPANQEPRQPTVGGWPIQPQGKETDPMAGMDAYSAQNGAARTVQPFWSHEPQAAGAEPLEEGTSIEIDEKVLDAYYNNIHKLFPILPSSRDQLRSRLRQSSRAVQEVFLHSLLAVTGAGSFRAENQFQEIPTLEKAQNRLYEWFPGDPGMRPLAANFILLHSILLLILEADQRGAQNFRGHSGIPKATLVEGGVSLGYYIAKPLGQLDMSNPDDKDTDSDSNLARRNWIVVGILARWHMLSTAGPDFFGNYEIATPEDTNIVNLATMQLARYSTIFAELWETFSDSYKSSAYAVSRAFKRMLTGQLTRIRDVEHLTPTQPVPAISSALESFSPLIYWTIQLLLKRHLYISVPAELLYPCQVILDIMSKQAEGPAPVSSPFHFHFLALATITLLELTEILELVGDVQEMLDKTLALISLREKHAATAGEFEKIFATQNWENTIRLFIEARRNQLQTTRSVTQQATHRPLGVTEQRSLQHLADLAVGAGGKAGEGSPPTTSAGNAPVGDKDTTAEEQKQDYPVFIDFRELTKAGYLNVLAGISS